ncbi:MAG: hypothetical protein V7K88_04900 [Nostoc sp.]|uniref:hypothetical protein n=1 Tax=Nostoc sp. TaxID=1180 RepID=UPI002FF9ABA1
MLKGLEALGILPKVHKKVWGIFQTVKVRASQKNANTGLAIVQKIVKIPGGRITSDSQINIGSTLSSTWFKQSDE